MASASTPSPAKEALVAIYDITLWMTLSTELCIRCKCQHAWNRVGWRRTPTSSLTAYLLPPGVMVSLWHGMSLVPILSPSLGCRLPSEEFLPWPQPSNRRNERSTPNWSKISFLNLCLWKLLGAWAILRPTLLKASEPKLLPALEIRKPRSTCDNASPLPFRSATAPAWLRLCRSLALLYLSTTFSFTSCLIARFLFYFNFLF